MSRLSDPRGTMVARQLMRRGITDGRVLRAMGTVPREEFVPPDLRPHAYEDGPLPIGFGQTISQPYVVAEMAQALRLRGGERVLEVGGGSGYAAAVLAELAAEVYTVERLPELAERATLTLARLGYDTVRVLHDDGTLGHAEAAPFDGIAVAAGAPAAPRALLAQLAPGGRLVIPVGASRHEQELRCYTLAPDGTLREDRLGPVRFVPLIGVEGWGE